MEALRSLSGRCSRLFDDPLFHDLWEEDLRVVSMAEEPADLTRPTAQEVGVEARRMQIFLDLVGMLSFDRQAHLLDPTFERLLDPHDVEPAEKLREVGDSCPPYAGPAWHDVMTFLRDLGYDPS